MKVIKSLAEVKGNVSLTIGNFDGVHLGHQEILKTIKDYSSSKRLSFVVITFVPHPMQILSPRDNFLINSYKQRRQYLMENGVDYIMELEFNRDFSTMMPSEFVDKYILENKVCDFFLGHDFAFGSNKSGDHNFIIDYCRDKDIKIHIMKEFVDQSVHSSISSSAVRSAINKGNVEEANQMLGRDFMISGMVVKGAGRGKQIGVPTANLGFDKMRKIPQRGVYSTKVKVDNQIWQSITNVGFNPTFNDTEDIFIETHILDFSNDIYGQEIEVSFISKIRNEKKFPNVNELISQIKDDIQTARDYFERN